MQAGIRKLRCEEYTVVAGRSERRSYTVFISHSSRDRWIARQISSEIGRRCSKAGVRTFLDEKDIEGGDVILDVVFDNIRKCDEFLVLLSRNSIKRPWVLQEIGGAKATRKRIIAIMCDLSYKDLPGVLAHSLSA